jgi:hypothetical protein
MAEIHPQHSQTEHISGWIDAMRFGLMGGRPFSEICVRTYAYYTEWFLEQYGCLSVENLKKVLLSIPIEHFAKRLKLFQSLTCFAKYLVQEGALDEAYLAAANKFKPRRHLPERKITVDQKGLDKLMEACHMAKIMQQSHMDGVIWCVDTWLGGLEHMASKDHPELGLDTFREYGYPRLFHQFLANVLHQGFQDRIIPVPNTSLIAARWFTHHQIQADLIYSAF